MSNLLVHRGALSYLDVCCYSLSKAKFEDILADDVLLEHQTNEDDPVREKGKDKVAALFQKYIFSNTNQINVQSCAFEAGPSLNESSIRLIVDENKKEEDGENRYRFDESTLFEFDSSVPQKITSIKTFVKSLPLSKPAVNSPKIEYSCVDI